MEYRLLVRNVEAEKLFESFLVSAITSVLAIRVFLKIANYPAIGVTNISLADMLFGLLILAIGGALILAVVGEYPKQIGTVLGGAGLVVLALTLIGKLTPTTGGIHIAHMLWGGMLMLISIMMLIMFLGKPAAQMAAVLGGIGFGAFIDEIGKVITHDNNYFFQPSIAIIYVIFVLIYISFQLQKKYAKLAEHEKLINALEMIKEAANNDLDSAEKRKAIQLLGDCDQKDPLVKSAKTMLKRIASTKITNNIFIRTKNFSHTIYQWLISQKWFNRALIAYFVFVSLGALWNATTTLENLRIVLLTGVGALFLFYRMFFNYTNMERKTRMLYIAAAGLLIWVTALFALNLRMPELTAMKTGELLSSVLGGVFVLLGVWHIRKSRFKAYRMFKYSILVSILLTQFFVFYREQLGAVIGLLWGILTFLAIDYMIEEEEVIRKNGKRKKRRI